MRKLYSDVLSFPLLLLDQLLFCPHRIGLNRLTNIILESNRECAKDYSDSTIFLLFQRHF